uniref:Putative LAGLIDADG homing endonuclease n=1 Tax=Stigeoclonium helveticum TaxID=55999 RepID=A0A6M4SPE0_STIHE|nr:putative LAGLIDADG homing endonuclease [Stigeoclonium helveticum]
MSMLFYRKPLKKISTFVANFFPHLLWDFFYLITVLQNKVKKMYTIAQSAGLVTNKCKTILYKNIFIKNNWGASPFYLKFFSFYPSYLQMSLINLRFYNTNTNPQRLNSKDLMWFVGFVEADGWFSINKNGKYAKYEFAVELSKRDIQLLYKIKSMLGVGSVTFCTHDGIELARLKISSKTDLISIIIPIFDKYNMLTNKHYDFIHFKSCLLNNIVYYQDVPLYTRPIDSFLKTEEILKVLYFDCWLVGFIEAEGCFSTYVEKQIYETASFEISQTNGLEIMLAIKKRLGISANPYLYESNYKLKTTSIRSIQNVIHFLKQTPAKLKGYKRAQYLKWWHSIRANPKYINVNVPFKY